MERGLRQEDPISPFLFLIVAEALNIVMIEAVSKQIFNPAKVGTDEVAVSHLQFADDTIFLGDWSMENAKVLMCLLKCLVQDRWKEAEEGWEWKWDSCRPIRGRVRDEWDGLTSLLQQVHLKGDKPDGWRWQLDGNSEYLVRFMSKAVDKVKAQNRGDPMRWCPIIPRKINIFAWRATCNLLPVMNLLHQRGIHFPSDLCLVCANATKTINHAIVRCPTVHNIWRAVSSWCNLDVSLLFDVSDILDGSFLEQSSQKSRKVWHDIVLCLAI